jgi:hypothetical protein
MPRFWRKWGLLALLLASFEGIATHLCASGALVVNGGNGAGGLFSDVCMGVPLMRGVEVVAKPEKVGRKRSGSRS